MPRSSVHKGLGRQCSWISAVVLLHPQCAFSLIATLVAHRLTSPRRGNLLSTRANESANLIRHRYPTPFHRPRTTATAVTLLTMTTTETGTKSPMTLSGFLQQASTESKFDRCRVHAFVGNEASDADSICSSICMAFIEEIVQRGLLVEGISNLDGAVKNPGLADVVDLPARGSQAGLVRIPGEFLRRNRHALLTCTLFTRYCRTTSILEIKRVVMWELRSGGA